MILKRLGLSSGSYFAIEGGVVWIEQFFQMGLRREDLMKIDRRDHIAHNQKLWRTDIPRKIRTLGFSL